jgi:RND family efflux transporter MFP subunit
MDSPSKSDLLNQLKIDRTTPPETSSLSLKHGLMVAVVSALLGAFTVHFFSNSGSDTSEKEAIVRVDPNTSKSPVELNSVNETTPQQTQQQSGQTESILNASGYITARRTATVSSEIMGLIKQVDVEEGMQVTQGQILAKLDDTLATVSVNLAQAQVESAVARNQSAIASLAEAQRQHTRTYSNQFSSDADKSRALTDLETADANLANTQADIKVAGFEAKRQQERLADHIIRAPFDGVVIIKNAQPGEIVSPSSAGGGFTRTGICTIVDMDSLEIEVDVNESFIGRVYANQKVEAQLDAYSDWTIPASVIAIIPTADRGKATVKVRIRIEIKDSKILPDMGVRVAFLK